MSEDTAISGPAKDRGGIIEDRTNPRARPNAASAIPRFQVESHPTNPPTPMAIWDMKDGRPGDGARLVANFYKTSATFEEAFLMAGALNRNIQEDVR